MDKWKEYSEKFLSISLREQYLILLAGLAAIVYLLFSVAIDGNIVQSKQYKNKISQLTSSNKSKKNSIEMFEQALTEDPNATVNKQIVIYEKQLDEVDSDLLTLTSELIDPIQMRFALLELLKLQKGVSLLSFQLVEAQSIAIANNQNTKQQIQNENQIKTDDNVEPSLNLYRHVIKLKLKGNYFQLRDYLTQLEQLSWKFFWQKFDYKLQEYPNSELEIEMYSLSTEKEFIGV